MLSTDRAAVLAFFVRQPRQEATVRRISEALDLRGMVNTRSLKQMNKSLELCRIVGMPGRGYRLEMK